MLLSPGHCTSVSPSAPSSSGSLLASTNIARHHTSRVREDKVDQHGQDVQVLYLCEGVVCSLVVNAVNGGANVSGYHNQMAIGVKVREQL